MKETFVSAHELAAREKKRLDVKKATYKAILEQFSRKISNAASLGAHELMLTTPRFIIGYPTYDVPTATLYLKRQLERLGYTIRLALDNTLHVSWPKPAPANKTVVIDHSDELPSLASLARTAKDIRLRSQK